MGTEAKDICGMRWEQRGYVLTCIFSFAMGRCQHRVRARREFIRVQRSTYYKSGNDEWGPRVRKKLGQSCSRGELRDISTRYDTNGRGTELGLHYRLFTTDSYALLGPGMEDIR